ncbi:glycoside hydrolase family 55 protein [Streptomyces sp. NBC_01275]|uniref:glycosyl hydrolase family 28-related protein n=1 Tax=Streptomyces sp. NBC_01275 TaxID=2903807 RepID=UPI0022598633|nr:glycosyl hydrolase family 28-related protein [Streptomyces sp. NBC_01275]MCX4766874.1 glycoside hydrolase family 55 protein [Streptomyces sp. NBC_01275]
MSRVSRRQLLRGGVSVLAATALTAHGASAAAGPGRGPGGLAGPVGPVGPGRGRVGDRLLSRVINVADLGAVGDGRTDDSAAFEFAYALAAARVSGGVGRTVIEIPPGEYLITRPHALLNGVAPMQPANGLRFQGAGKRMTTLVFRPPVGPGSYLCRNEDIWSNLSFERMQFRSATPGASFFSSYSTGQAQDYRFSEVEWMGEWEYGLSLAGSDTNSEMRWEACRVGGSYRRAFLYSGLTRSEQREPNDQDQFLNYWFTDMKVEYQWGNFLEFPYGGSITCRGGSYIITGTRPQSTEEYGTTSTFFRFPVSQHHDSVQRFHAQDIRFEVRNPDARIIDCTWKSGTVHFSDCDDTGLAFKDFSTDVRAHRYTVGPRGPLIRYDSCQLVGRHEYRPADLRTAVPTVARYDMCLLRSHPENEFAVAESGGRPEFVSFVDCLDGDGSKGGAGADAEAPAPPAAEAAPTGPAAPENPNPDRTPPPADPVVPATSPPPTAASAAGR